MISLLNKVVRRAIKHGKFKLASGQESLYYIDLSQCTLTRDGLSAIVCALVNAVEWEGMNTVGGPAIGAVPLVAGLLTHFYHLPLPTGRPGRGFFVRNTAKDHGDGQLIEGPLQVGDKVILVEDVTTTGNSLLKTAQLVESYGANIVRVVTVVNREAGAKDLFNQAGYKFISLLSVSELLEPESEVS